MKTLKFTGIDASTLVRVGPVMGHLHWTTPTLFLTKIGRKDSLRTCRHGLYCGANNNASKCGRELDTMVDGKYGGSSQATPQFQPCYCLFRDSLLVHFYF